MSQAPPNAPVINKTTDEELNQPRKPKFPPKLTVSTKTSIFRH